MKKLFIYLAVLTSILIVLGSCATNKMEYISKDYEIYGTWVNPEYDDSKAFSGKVVFSPNGSAIYYKLASDTTTGMTWKFVITNKWSDSEGNTWYTYIFSHPGIAGYMYTTTRISAGGKVLESNFSARDYPITLNPNDALNPNYTMHYRK